MKRLDPTRRKLLGRALALGALTALPACDYDDPAHPDLTDRFLQAMSRWNDRVQAALFSRHTLAPTFSAAQITNPPRFNAFYDISQAPVVDPATYRLELSGQIQETAPWSLAQLRAMKQEGQITRLVCVEGWRVIGQWMAIAACITGIYCALRLTAENTPPPASSGTPAVARPILAARAWAGYAALLVAPVNLHMERDVGTHPGKDASATLHSARMLEYQTLAGVLLFGGFCFWWWRSWRNAPGAALCLSAFIIAYLPISDLLPLNATMAEHWLYVPSAFLFIAALITLRDWLPGAPAAGRVAVRLIGAAWYCFLVYRTADQQQFWQDQRAFITHTMAAGGDTARMRMNLGALESSEGRNDLALTRYREAVERSPDLPIVWLSYASVLLRARDFEGARHALEKAEASPMFAAECAQTRAVLEHLQTGADTGDMLRKAAEVAPRNWPVRQRYVEYLMERGSLEAALHELRGFIEAHPFRGESWKLLGTLLERMRTPDLALTAYQQAAELDVHDEESRKALRRLEAERRLRAEAPPRKSARAFGKEAGNPLDIA